MRGVFRAGWLIVPLIVLVSGLLAWYFPGQPHEFDRELHRLSAEADRLVTRSAEVTMAGHPSRRRLAGELEGLVRETMAQVRRVEDRAAAGDEYSRNKLGGYQERAADLLERLEKELQRLEGLAEQEPPYR